MLTRKQLLKYPFSRESRNAVQDFARDVRALIDVLSSERYEYLIEAAEERVNTALKGDPIKLPDNGDSRDVLVYPTARLIVEKINHPRLKQYQAEAESKAVNRYLGYEKDRIVVHLCSTSFDWSIESLGAIAHRGHLPLVLRTFDFKIRFEDFLEVAPTFHQAAWKLINRYVEDGYVFIKRSELDRLMSGKSKQLILESSLDVPTLPQRLTEAVQRIESQLRGRIKKTEPVKMTGDVTAAFPPCIAHMYDDSVQGKNLAHDARFALASFLLKIGMTEEEVIGVFKAAPDFARGLAEYQVRHIASKSGGEGYTPPSCKKLQGSSLCPVYLGEAWDPLCEYILHPLAFYQTRAWEVTKGVDSHDWYAREKQKKQNF
ncbi:MAG: hypothetical protein ACOC3C_06875 [Candidatus Thorarchaeota archaeon]